jgi:YidC/Oxa1 family membrane protein insertase
MFPIAQKQFASMAAMKAVQPKMKEIQERFKDDKQRQQQEIMKLYKDEKVNPLAGCLPLVIQIPIFFALYKVLVLAIEMRHEPFIAVDQGPVRTRSGAYPQPVRDAALRRAGLPCDRPARGIARHHDVADVQAQPLGDGPRAAADVRDHAVDPDVRDGALCRWSAALLGDLEHPHRGAAKLPLFAHPQLKAANAAAADKAKT